MRGLAGVLALVAPLAACGDLPRPFMGAPGAAAMRLRLPPPPRLAVPPPSEALLSDEASRAFADDMAQGLQAQEVPAVAAEPKPSDWQLVTTAEERGGAVVPVFTVRNPKGEPQGNAEGKPVPLSDWAAARPATLQQAAADAAPSVSALLSRIQAALLRSDPNSLYNRPARVLVETVDGAPGDGDRALTAQMKDQLAKLGPIVQDTGRGADFSVAGHVRTAPGAGGTMRVEIQWVVKDARGDERGRILQLNEVPPGSLDHFWGDVAVVVAQEASGGVRDVILTQSGRR
jgi:hypothetical protein